MGGEQMSIRLLVMLNRKPGMRAEEFRTAYETGHVPLALRLFGHLWLEYRRNYMGSANSFASASGAPVEGKAAQVKPPFDVVTELVFKDVAALEEMNRIYLENVAEITADEDRMFDRPNCWLVRCDTIEQDLTPYRNGPLV